MQLFSRNKALAALSLGALAALGACGDDVTVAAPTPAPVTVTISPSNANLTAGSTQAIILGVTVTGGATTPDFQCTASPAGVVTVAKVATGCSVTAGNAPGVATVIATAGTASAAAQVTVGQAVPAIAGIAISPAALNLQVNATSTISANPTTIATGATVAKTYVSSNPTIVRVDNAQTGAITAVAPGQATITVTLVGTGTGLTRAEVTGQAVVTVSANPPAVSAITTNPTSALLVVGGTPVSGTSTVTAGAGVNPTFSWGSSNPGVATATVNASTGAFTITAVGPGQAVITITAQGAATTSLSAASVTAQIPVTVNAAPQVTIANITQGTTNDPVDINNVSGQIQVALNLATNNNVVSRVRLYVCDANGCATAPAAEQSFGTAGAASGQLNMFINTASFSVASDWSSSTVAYKNGQKTLKATLDLAQATADNNLAILTFNNQDGFAAKHTAPVNAQNSAAGYTYRGGPGANGVGSISVVDVIYTDGRSITEATFGLAGCGDPQTRTASQKPWTATYGYDAVADINCEGYEAPDANDTPNFPVVTASIDNNQNVGPTATVYSTTAVNGYRTNTAATPAVVAPAAIRVDYRAPQGGSLPLGSVNNRWINASYTFAISGLTDAGVGLKATRDTRYQYRRSTAADRCTAPADWTALPGGNKFTNVASESECQDVFTNNVFTARALENDRLDNESTTSLSGGPFGVDVTAPAITWVAANTDADKAVVDSATDISWQAEFLDSRSGFTATPQFHSLVQANAPISANFPDVVDGRGKCLVGGGSPTTLNTFFTTTFLSAPACTPAVYSSTLAAGATLNHQANPAVSAVTGAVQREFGYFRYSTYVVDQAGNQSATLTRMALATGTASPNVTGLTVGTNITNTPFRPTVDDSVEVTSASMVLSYAFTTTAEERDSLVYPRRAFAAQAGGLLALDHSFTGTTVATSPFLFDDVLFWRRSFDIHPLEYLPSTFTGAQRTFTSVIERVGTNGAVDPAATPVKADFVTARVWNARSATAAGLRQANILASNTPNVAYARYAAKNADSAAVRVDTFTVLGNFDAVGAAPAALPKGLKAQAISPISATQPPFARVDFYQLSATGGEYRYIGSATNAVTNAVGGVTLTQNANNRFWTYTIDSKVYGWSQILGGAATAIDAGTYIAIGVNAQGMGLQTLGTAVIGTPPASPFRR